MELLEIVKISFFFILIKIKVIIIKNKLQQDPTTAADNAIKAIAKIEGDFQAALDLSYATMGDTTFKALRRMLPIHRSKMDWDWLKIQALKVGTDAVNQQ